MQFDVAVALPDRRHPIGAMLFEVVGVECAAGIARSRDDFPCELAPIERFTTRLRDQFERARKIGSFEQLAGARRATLRQEMRDEIRKRLELRGSEIPVVRRLRTDVKAVARIADRRVEQLRERQPAEAFRQRHPRAHGAGYGHAVPTEAWHVCSTRESLCRPTRR